MRPRAGSGLLLIAVLASGCATWAKHGVELVAPRKLRVAVLPVRFEVKIRHLKEIETVPAGPAPSADAEASAVSSATAALSASMRDSFASALDQSYYFSASTATADVNLRVTVLGYGRIKRSWIFLLLGGGLVEGTVQGVAVAEAAGSVPAAIAVACEEVLQEVAVDVGGVFLLDRWFTPVVLKAELVSARDGRVIWRAWAWGDRDRKALKKLPSAERAKKEVRLGLVFDRARGDLMRKLTKAAARNAAVSKDGAD
ncbi:MAG: hypothetical protein KGJ84_12050 [Elusimicrobia bacterium]|nr:hypothetical protein [Elusimicrobiota bacterium]